MFTLPEKITSLAPYEIEGGCARVRMDANESFLSPLPRDEEAMAAAAATIALNRYPDPLAMDLCAAFGEAYHVDPALVTAGNGSDELISIIAASLTQKGDTAVTTAPEFSMYAFYASLAETRCVPVMKGDDLKLDVDAALDIIKHENARVFLFSNPCNPTSLGLTRNDVRRLLTGTDALVVLDEAYMDFWDQSLLPEVGQYDNLIILRTCSKALGLAALRVGFAVANPALTKALGAAKSPYNVNAVSQAMATVALRNPMYREAYVPLIVQSRDMLAEGLRAQGWRVLNSVTNFVTVPTDNAHEIAARLAARGVRVRAVGNLLRVTASDEEDNKEFLRLMEEWKGE
ncbi:MAG: histidinol-phosphate aminotransferase family protein [Oscillospiraceae bacterium]|nr:histidinol-phosphate aminotransferase family protein [Oscillospiraceae bacterium]